MPGSDLDIVCEAPGLAAFRQTLAGFAAYPNYALQLADMAAPALVASFSVEGLAVEVFGQALPTACQHGYRHLVVEARLPAPGGGRYRPSKSAA